MVHFRKELSAEFIVEVNVVRVGVGMGCNWCWCVTKHVWLVSERTSGNEYSVFGCRLDSCDSGAGLVGVSAPVNSAMR